MLVEHIKHQAKVLQSVASTILQGGRGVSGTPTPNQPAQPLQVYDIEGSPFCRRVREVMTTLNLDYEVYPCPKNGTRYRPVAAKIIEGLGGKLQFPLLVDQNSGKAIQESQDIVDYLFATYGKTGRTPKKWQNLPKTPIRELLVTGASLLRGIQVDIDRKDAPEQLLELWGFDASPYTRLVRERLCELEIAFIFHNVAKERWQDMGPAVLRLKPGRYIPLPGGKREHLLPIMHDKMQVPYLVDPNTGVEMFESEAVLHYLNRQYGAK